MFGMMEALLSFIRRQVGLRTDTASASGSLHAKIAKAISDISDVSGAIGTSSDDRADNTVLGWLSSPIKSVQRGTINVNNPSSTATISSVNTAKAFVNMLGFTWYGSQPANIRLALTNSTTVTATKGYDSSDGEVSFEVIEFY